MSSAEQDLFTRVLSFKHDPVGFIYFCFPWGVENGPLEKHTGPRKWQLLELIKIRDYVRANRNAEINGEEMTVLYMSICSGRGIGKSAFLAMINYWVLSCWLGATAIVTANTETQLRTRTMAEIGKWHGMAINGHWYEKTALSIKPNKDFKDMLRTQLKIDSGYYYCEAQNWSKDKPDAFAGVHSQVGLIVSFDEASGIDDSIYSVTEGFFTDLSPLRIWVLISNGRKITGKFFESFHKDKAYWTNTSIDSRSVEGLDKNTYQRIIDANGLEHRDSRVEVRGLFPLTGEDSFISHELAEDAYARVLEREYNNNEPLLMGVDVARFGDDKTVFAFRQGRNARVIPFQRYTGDNTMIVADHVAEAILRYNIDKVFIDGVGVGGGVVDRLVQMGYSNVIIEVAGSNTPNKPLIYANKRAEMWGDMKDWLQTGYITGDLRAQLTCINSTTSSERFHGKILLESKEALKKRGISSPDDADALSFTFARKVASGVIRNGRKIKVINNSHSRKRMGILHA
jgi:hypothetical protein